MSKTTVIIYKMHDWVQAPEYKTLGSSGADIRSAIDDIYIAPMQRLLIPTGFKMALKTGYEAQIRPRSGMAINHGITVINSPGTIDYDYRGEVKVALINLSQERFLIKKNMRIAQMIINKVEQAGFLALDDNKMDNTERGDGGFGSTGEL